MLQAKTMTVYVTIGDQNLSCEVRRGDTVQNLKSELHQQQPSLHMNKVKLTYKDTVLEVCSRLLAHLVRVY